LIVNPRFEFEILLAASVAPNREKEWFCPLSETGKAIPYPKIVYSVV